MKGPSIFASSPAVNYEDVILSSCLGNEIVPSIRDFQVAGDDSMRSIRFGASAGLLLFLLLISAEEGYPESTPVQRRRIDLSSSPDVQEAGPIDANTRINLAYLGQNRLAVVLLFPNRVNGRFSPVRDEETWRVLLLSVDSSEGKILHSFRFGDFHGEGANSEWLQLGVVNSDELLVIFGNELVRFSSDLVPLARRTLAREVQVRNGLHYYDP
jgi:hypothetical protein